MLIIHRGEIFGKTDWHLTYLIRGKTFMNYAEFAVNFPYWKYSQCRINPYNVCVGIGEHTPGVDKDTQRLLEKFRMQWFCALWPN